MKRVLGFLISCLLHFAVFNAPAQVTFRITSLPDDTPLEDRIFLAGTFNNWNPGDTTLSVAWKDPARRAITVSPAPGRLEFKFTRGAWSSAEGNAQGQFLPNRTLDYRGMPLAVDVIIQSWEDIRPSSTESTAAPNVYLLSEDFYMPQLDRHRRILIYLPYDYFSSEERYPVLYLHDGQNLFDAATSFAGEWQLDETLNQLMEEGLQKVIAVGIDNGGAERLNELTPYPNPQYGGGRGEDYLLFIAETLKPYVDQHYRTLPGTEHTTIMGSSLGGLISMYAAIAHPAVFGQAGVLSPSLWWSDQIFYDASHIDPAHKQNIFLLGSERESQNMRAQLEAMYNTLRSAGIPEENIQLRITPDGTHSESYWARELPGILRWLYRKNRVVPTVPRFAPLVVKTTRDLSHLKIRGRRFPDNLKIQLVDANGRPVAADLGAEGKKVTLPNRSAPAPYAKVYDGERLLVVVKIQ